MEVRKIPLRITPSSRRTLVRPFVPGNTVQVEHILFRLMAMSKEKKSKLLSDLYERMDVPHEKLRSIFLRHSEHVRNRIPSDIELTTEELEFIGAVFTQQYSLESTALFNPSIVLHPRQDIEGVSKFIISLRAIGEGHISSITFMEGQIDQNHTITLKVNSPIVYEPERKEHEYEKKLFMKKTNELGLLSPLNSAVFDSLADYFTLENLEKSINRVKGANVAANRVELENSLNNIRLLALSNFTLDFSTDDISEQAIYPASPSQSNGLEDARFVRFVEDNGSVVYYATFTAYDGKTIMSEMLETVDFKEFKIFSLNGPAARNKGMALFPRRINGLYMMLGRQDNESLYIMQSDNPHFWYDARPLIKPTFDWEMIQIGNCGSPIEIEEGWLVLTHGVGPVRTYSLGAILLDKNEPWRVIGRLREPLLSPGKDERFGYVPNVIYTCGGLVLGRTLILPYAIGDVVTTFATVELDGLLGEMGIEQ